MQVQPEITTQPRWVKVMAEYTSTGLWDSRGTNVEESFVPMSPSLQARLNAWCVWYENNDDYLPESTGEFDYAGFSAEGLAIARAIKAELPDWTVVYFDEGAMRQAGENRTLHNRESFEYEVQAD
jgi:hypothetical protein